MSLKCNQHIGKKQDSFRCHFFKFHRALFFQKGTVLLTNPVEFYPELFEDLNSKLMRNLSLLGLQGPS